MGGSWFWGLILKFFMKALSSHLVKGFSREEECSREDEKKTVELKLVDPADLSLESISFIAKKKALMIVDYLECSHPAFLADFLNHRSNYKINISHKHLTSEIEGLSDPRKVVILNYARILDIFRDVPLNPPKGFEEEREFLDI